MSDSFESLFGLGYIKVATEHVDDWLTFGENVLGMKGVEVTPDRGYLRMDDRLSRVTLDRPIGGQEEGIAALGWEVASREIFTTLFDRLDNMGYGPVMLSDDEAADRRVSAAFACPDPSGFPCEFFYGAIIDPIDRFVSPRNVDFVTGEQGMGHLTVTVAKYDETIQFYREGLRMHIRESLDTAVQITFMGCNPRQHSIAVMASDENSVHHIMVEVSSIDDVGRAYDRCFDGAAPLTKTLGRHWNDNMFSFYARTPSGFAVEFGAEGRTVCPATWSEITQGGVGGGSYWGHRPVLADGRVGSHQIGAAKTDE